MGPRLAIKIFVREGQDFKLAVQLVQIHADPWRWIRPRKGIWMQHMLLLLTSNSHPSPTLFHPPPILFYPFPPLRWTYLLWRASWKLLAPVGRFWPSYQGTWALCCYEALYALSTGTFHCCNMLYASIHSPDAGPFQDCAIVLVTCNYRKAIFQKRVVLSACMSTWLVHLMLHMKLSPGESDQFFI